MKLSKVFDYLDLAVTAACVVWIVVLVTGCSTAPVSKAYHPTMGLCRHPSVLEGVPFPVGEDAEIEGDVLRFTKEDGSEQTELLGVQCVIKRTK